MGRERRAEQAPPRQEDLRSWLAQGGNKYLLIQLKEISAAVVVYAGGLLPLEGGTFGDLDAALDLVRHTHHPVVVTAGSSGNLGVGLQASAGAAVPKWEIAPFCHTFPQFDPEKGLAAPPNPRKRRHLKNRFSLVSSVSTVSFSWVILVKEWLSGRDAACRTLISQHRKCSAHLQVGMPTPHAGSALRDINDDPWKGGCSYVSPKTTEIHTPTHRREPGERQEIPRARLCLGQGERQSERPSSTAAILRFPPALSGIP